MQSTNILFCQLERKVAVCAPAAAHLPLRAQPNNPDVELFSEAPSKPPLLSSPQNCFISTWTNKVSFLSHRTIEKQRHKRSGCTIRSWSEVEEGKGTAAGWRTAVETGLLVYLGGGPSRLENFDRFNLPYQASLLSPVQHFYQALWAGIDFFIFCPG